MSVRRYRRRWRGSQSRRSQAVKIRALLVATADREQHTLAEGATGKLETGGQAAFAGAVHEEEARHAAQVRGSADAGPARVIGVDLVERGVDRPGDGRQRRRD